MADPISPMILARKLNIKPQLIYGLLRNGKIKNLGGEGKKLVDPEEVIKYVSSPRKVGRPSTDSVLEGFNVKKGEVLAWVTEVQIQKQVVVTEKELPDIIMARKFLNPEKYQNAMTPIRKVSLANHIKDGTITRAEVWDVLNAIEHSWRVGGEEHLADGLRDWIASHRSDKDEHGPEDESQAEA